MMIRHWTAAALIAASLSGACTRAVVYKEGKESSPKPVVVEENGPPPHAPAYGYRRNHEGDDVELVFDRSLNVYIVSGYRDTYYSAGQYFRFVDGSWEWSVSVSTGWKLVADYRDVPSTLCAKHGRGKNHGKHKGHDKD
jgi:hypothetical protein